MTINELYVTLVQFFVAGIFLNVAVAVLTIIAAVGEYLRCDVPFESMLETFYDFYLKGFLPTMLIQMTAVFALKIIGGY